MKLTDIIGNQCIRIFPATQPGAKDNVRALHLIRAFEARYGFFQGPKSLNEFDPATGIVFLHGQFQRRWVIDKFQFFNNGVLVEGKISTDELDLFLDEVIPWAHTEIGIPVPKEQEVKRSYLSQIELEMDVSLGSVFSQFLKLGKDLCNTIVSYGQNAAPFELTNLSFSADLLQTPMPRPGAAFIFARREGQPFTENRYFSSAPLKSADHLRFLEQLQNVLLGKLPRKGATH